MHLIEISGVNFYKEERKCQLEELHLDEHAARALFDQMKRHWLSLNFVFYDDTVNETKTYTWFAQYGWPHLHARFWEK